MGNGKKMKTKMENSKGMLGFEPGSLSKRHNSTWATFPQKYYIESATLNWNHPNLCIQTSE